MCEPTTIMMGVGVATSLAGSYMSAQSDVAAGHHSKDVAEQNAKMAELAANDTVARGNIASGQARMEGTAAIGEQQAGYGASGVDGTVGSPLAAMANTRMMSEYAAKTLQNNAAREAWGYRQDAKNTRAEGEYALQAAKNKATATILGGAGGALSGGASAYSNYKKQG